jgi:hypothetical protein
MPCITDNMGPLLAALFACLKIVFLKAREIFVMVYELMLGLDQLKQQWK